jgi:hypothetical protein
VLVGSGDEAFFSGGIDAVARIDYSLDREGEVDPAIYDVASGIYFCRISSLGSTDSVKIVLLC